VKVTDAELIAEFKDRLEMANKIKELEAKLAEAERDRDGYKEDFIKYMTSNRVEVQAHSETRKRLAIAEAKNKKLREALEKIVDRYFDLPYEVRMKKDLKEGKESSIAREALKEDKE
jgi:MinD-like ATPase involved in chromosome partitioning or flagellar assembly